MVATGDCGGANAHNKPGLNGVIRVGVLLAAHVLYATRIRALPEYRQLDIGCVGQPRGLSRSGAGVFQLFRTSLSVPLNIKETLDKVSDRSLPCTPFSWDITAVAH